MILSIEIMSLSIEIMSLSIEIMILSIEIMILSIEIMIVSIEIMILSIAIVFVSIECFFRGGACTLIKLVNSLTFLKNSHYLHKPSYPCWLGRMSWLRPGPMCGGMDAMDAIQRHSHLPVTPELSFHWWVL